MDERFNDALVLQREIAEKRQDLATSLERLRGTVRQRLEVGRQIGHRALVIALVGGAILSLFFFGARARRRQRKRWF